MRNQVPSARRAVRGAALAEFVVFSLVWLPLLLLVPKLGKLLDLYRTAESASRYGVFEASVHHTANGWKPDSQVAAELRQRLFAQAGQELLSDGNVGRAAQPQHLWSDNANRPWLVPSDQSVRVDSATLRRNVIGSAAVPARQLQLPNNNRYRLSVTVDPARVPGLRPFDRMNLDSTRQAVLLVDTWAAAGTGTVRRRVERAPLLAPAQAMEPLVDAFGLLPQLLFDPRWRLGEFDWDAVPCDRLERGCL